MKNSVGKTTIILVLISFVADASFFGTCRYVYDVARSGIKITKQSIVRTVHARGLNLFFTPSSEFWMEDLEHNSQNNRMRGLIKIHERQALKAYYQEGLFQAPVLLLTGAVMRHPVSLHPQRAFNRGIVIPSTEFLSEAVTGKKFRTSRMINFAAGIAVYAVIIGLTYDFVDDKITKSVAESGRQNLEELFFFASRDVRGTLFFPGIEPWDLNSDIILAAVIRLREAYDEYYKERMQYSSGGLRSLRLSLQDHVAMFSVRNFFDGNLNNLGGFYVPESAHQRLTEETKDTIFQIEDQFLRDTELLYLLVGLNPITQQARKFTESAESKVRLEELRNHEFLQTILTRSEVLKRKKIDVLYWSQVFLFWEKSFSIWDSLGIKKYKLLYENGVPVVTNSFLTIEDVKAEVLAGL